MARGRFISTSIAEDDRLSRLSLTAELLYLKTIPHLDRDGMISGRAGLLWGKVCPLREELINEMQRAIDGWVQVGLVIRMSTDEGPVLFFPGFLKNNTLLHYDRETPSKFPVPPGYERTVMGLVVEGTEQKKKPTKKPKEAQVPPSSNGNGAEVIDSINEVVIDSINEVVIDIFHDSINDFASKGEVEVKDQVQEEGDRVRAQDPPTPPPSYRKIPDANEYIPGVRRPQYNQAKRNCDHFTGQASKYSVGPEPFRLMVDAVLDAAGKTSLANTNGDLGQQTLNAAKQTVIDLLEMQRHTLEDVETVLLSWRENDWRGTSPPTFRQIVEHASAMDAGTHITAKRQDIAKKEFASFADYNEWAARNDPDYKRIREGVLIKGVTVKRDSYQPAMVH